jgi:hypothetical protein
MTVGSRAQVMRGTKDKTSGGLTKGDLKYNSQGRIVSKKKSISAKKDNRLVNAGYVTEKGKFGAIKIEPQPKNTPRTPKKIKRTPKKSPRKRSSTKK